MTETPEDYDDTVLRLTERYVAERQAGGQPRLSAYLPRHAGHAGAVADFVAYYLSVEEHVPSPADVEHPVSLSRYSQTALERLKEIPAFPPTLLRTRKGRQLTPRQLAQALDLSGDLVLLLERRQLDPETLPEVLYNRLARGLGYSVAAMRAYLELAQGEQAGDKLPERKQRPRKVAERQSAYSEPKRSFRSALEGSAQLTDQQKANWRTILEQERLL